MSRLRRACRLREGMRFMRFRNREILVRNYNEKSGEPHVPKTEFGGPHEEGMRDQCSNAPALP
jgi:hypothetical protein